MNTGEIAGERLLSFIQRIEHVQDQLDELNDDKGEIFKEAKSTGFDTNIIKAVLKRRRNGKGATEEADSLLSIYERAIENAEGSSTQSSRVSTRTRTRDGDGRESGETAH